MIGKTISDFKIIEKLGQGGMGIVYLAQDTKLDRQVAIKSLPQQIATNSDERKRFELEAKATAALNHPNIATVYSIENIEDEMYIIMEYIEGQELKEVVKKADTALNKDELLKILDMAVQLISGLHAAHTKDIIHRDIKTSNIMLTSDGQIKIMDFGLAKVTGGPDITKEQSTLGTTAYMSPEQTKGEQTDHRTDIWSFGVVLYEILTGQKPFKGDYDQAIIYSILNEDPVSVSSIQNGISAELEQVVNKCLAKNPDERYQRADDIITDLQEVMNDLKFGERPRRLKTAPVKIKKANVVFGIFTFITVIATLLNYFIFPDEDIGKSGRKMLVVLPFENLGPHEAEYFAEGMTEEITSRLAAISSLGIVSRKSALRYRDSNLTAKEIGEELGVNYILEGTVRWTKDEDGTERVRITPQLIQAENDIHLWAHNYERIIKDIFNVQSEIAQNVAQQMGITLLEDEKETIKTVPTNNMDAYHAFLKGKYFINTPHFTYENWQTGIDNLQQAIELDSVFALAYSELSKAHARLYFVRYDLSEARMTMAKNAAIMALKYANDSPEVHLNVGHYYLWAERDNIRALEEFGIAEKDMPNNVELLKAKSRLYQTLGRWPEYISTLEKIIEFSPRDPWAITALTFAYWFGHQYELAMKTCNQALVIAPESIWPNLYKANIIWLTTGPNEKSREIMKPVPVDHSFWFWSWYWQEVGEGKYDQALELIRKAGGQWMKNKLYVRPKPMLSGIIYEFLNKNDIAWASYDSARVMLEKELLNNPKDPRYFSSLGIVQAALGNKDEAIKNGLKALELLPIEKDAVYGSCYVVDMAVIYTKTEKYELALDLIEQLLEVPSFISPAWLKMDIRFSPLYENPRFQKLLTKYST